MQSSSLRLEEFLLTKLSLDWQVGRCDCEETCPYSVDVDYFLARKEDDDRSFRLQLRVVLRVADDCTGLNIDSVIDGFFSFPEGTSEEDMQYLVRVNGATILYGILRGQVAMISGSFPTGKLNLPAIVMHDVLPEIDRGKQEQVSKLKDKG